MPGLHCSAYLHSLVKAGDKFIVFAHHRLMLDAISQLMHKLNVDHVRIDGRTPNDVRTVSTIRRICCRVRVCCTTVCVFVCWQKFVDRFQTDDNCRVAVLSLKACNAGITLTATQLVIFAELYWNPSVSACGATG